MLSPSTPTCMLDDFRCRLCLRSSEINLKPLFPPGDDCFVNELLSRIYDCLSIHVSFLEDFCSVICSACSDKIDSFYNFKKQCQSNDGYLREKRSRLTSGMEFERMSRMNRDQTDDNKLSPEAMVNIPSKVDVAVQISGASSSESFRGFVNEFIDNSVTEAPESSEMNDLPSVQIDDIQKCHVPLEKLDIKPSVVQQLNAKKSNCSIASAKHKKQTKPDHTTKNKALSPRLLRKKAVLYFDGYEYRKPRPCLAGSIRWECCKISCSATLQQEPDGKLKLNDKHQQHQQQVIRDGTILDRRMRKRVPFLVTNNNHRRKFIYNDSFRYHFSQKLLNGQMIWICDDEPEGCKAYVRISEDFRSVMPVFQHNHTAELVVHRRIVN